MKIDIGNGKILGTKKVSANGQISGFTEYAGREVLVVLPDGEPQVRLDAREYAKELQTAAHEHMKLAFIQYKDLKKRFETPDRATKEFMSKHAPETFQGLYEKVDSFVKSNLGKAEARVEKALGMEGSNGHAPEPAKETEEIRL
ncbi:MAG TPA: hypothetical protein VM889_01790 [Candidatus Thermoplasmatota archaeon]|nr:hypothetical protein [Candidatus Thermoplasmatota archaeon]